MASSSFLNMSTKSYRRGCAGAILIFAVIFYSSSPTFTGAATQVDALKLQLRMVEGADGENIHWRLTGVMNKIGMGATPSSEGTVSQIREERRESARVIDFSITMRLENMINFFSQPGQIKKVMPGFIESLKILKDNAVIGRLDRIAVNSKFEECQNMKNIRNSLKSETLTASEAEEGIRTSLEKALVYFHSMMNKRERSKRYFLVGKFMPRPLETDAKSYLNTLKEGISARAKINKTNAGSPKRDEAPASDFLDSN